MFFMADFSVIADTSDSVLKLLRAHLCPEPVASPEADRLASPSDKNGDFQLGIFLYDLREQGEYKSSQPVRRADNTRTPPPKPLTMSYLLFLNSKAQIAAGAEAEQRILGRALQVLADYSTIDVTAAHSLAEGPKENASVTFLNLSFEDKSKIWSALNCPYQVGIYFSVSPVLLESRRSETFTRVTSFEAEAQQMGRTREQRA